MGIVYSLCIDRKWIDIFHCRSLIAFDTLTFYVWEQHEQNLNFFYIDSRRAKNSHIFWWQEICLQLCVMEKLSARRIASKMNWYISLLHCVSYIDFLWIWITGKKFTTRSYNTNSTGNNNYFAHPSNLMQLRKIARYKRFYQLFVMRNCILTNDQLERVVRRTRSIQS